MKLRHLFALAAVTGSLTFTASSGHASYTYSTTPTPAVTNFGDSTATLSSVTSGTPLTDTTFVNIANVVITSTTAPPGTDTTSIPVSIPVVITNTPTAGLPGTGTITVMGTLAITRSDSGGEISTFVLSSIVNNGAIIGGGSFTLSSPVYSAPTVNATSTGIGNISMMISDPVVPEPASLVMLGSGLVAVLGLSLGLRRRKKA